jgi:hypothetical protein
MFGAASEAEAIGASGLPIWLYLPSPCGSCAWPGRMFRSGPPFRHHHFVNLLPVVVQCGFDLVVPQVVYLAFG